MQRGPHHFDRKVVESSIQADNRALPKPNHQNFRSGCSTRNFRQVSRRTVEEKDVVGRASFPGERRIRRPISHESVETKLPLRKVKSTESKDIQKRRYRGDKHECHRGSFSPRIKWLRSSSSSSALSELCDEGRRRRRRRRYQEQQPRQILVAGAQRRKLPRRLRRSSSSDHSKSSLIVLYRGDANFSVSDTRKSRENQTSESNDSRVSQCFRVEPPTRPCRVKSALPSCCCVPKIKRQVDSKSAELYYCRSPAETPCFDSALKNSSLMAQRSGQQRAQDFEPDLGLLMQHLHVNTAGENQLHPSDSQRVFPFQDTPSGNLKIVPNQVVFESKKVSVLVAEPRHTKVNVKAERTDHATSRPREIDLPPGVTNSAVDRLQAQHRLPIVPSKIRPKTQPINREKKMLQMKEEMNKSSGDNEQEHAMQDVPLSALGFTTQQPIDWKNISIPEKTDLYQELYRRITTYKNADCIVRIGNDEFHCHLLVLQSYSAFFDDKNIKEIDLAGSSVTSRAFSIIYDWMISPTGECCQLLRRDNILEIFLAAQNLGIKELEEQCWAFIDNDELFSEDTAFLLYMEARKMENTAVMELMVPRIMKFFLMLVSTKDFLELDVEEMCLLLRSNYISVNSEMEVLMSAVRWLMHDWEGRKQFLIDVMKCVRFGLIAPWQLVDVKRNPENPEFMELMSYPEIQKMVDDGLAFVIIKYWYSNQTEDYYHWIDLLGLTEPTNRNWAGEDKNYVTYKEFLLYLKEYQTAKLSELKNKKTEEKPSPPSSPPNDDSTSPHSVVQPRGRLSHHNIKVGEMSSAPSNSRPLKHPTPAADASGNNVPHAVPPCMMMPPDVLNQYLSSMGRNVTKSVSKTISGFTRPKN